MDNTLVCTHKSMLVNMSYEDVHTIEPGETVEYCGHVPGGNIVVTTTKGERLIAHPGCFGALSQVNAKREETGS